MLSLRFHPEVLSEIKASYTWYQEQAEGLGDDYLNELESAYQAIIEGSCFKIPFFSDLSRK